MIQPRLVEQMVQTPPEGMEHWRMYRIEYGNDIEGLIWLPAHIDPSGMEKNLQAMAKEAPEWEEYTK